MNCRLYCTLSYEQVINIKHCDSCQFSELLRLLSARAHLLSLTLSPCMCVFERDCHQQQRCCLQTAWIPFSLESICPSAYSLMFFSCHIFSCTTATALVPALVWIPFCPPLVFRSEERLKKKKKKFLQKVEAALLASYTLVQQYEDSALLIFFHTGPLAHWITHFITQLWQDVKWKDGAMCKSTQQRTAQTLKICFR